MLKKLLFILLCLHFYSSYADEKFKQIIIASEELEELSQANGQGMYFDLLRLIYEPEGIELKIKVLPYKRSVFLVQQKKADLWLGSYRDEEDFALYPEYAYDYDEVAVLFKTSKYPNFAGVKSLQGQKVAWITGYDFNEDLEELYNIKVTGYERNNRQSALLSLQANRFDIFIDDMMDLENAIEEGNFNMSAYHLVKIADFKLFPAFRNDDRGRYFRNIWDKRMKKLKFSDELLNIYQDYEYAQEDLNIIYQ